MIKIQALFSHFKVKSTHERMVILHINVSIYTSLSKELQRGTSKALIRALVKI